MCTFNVAWVGTCKEENEKGSDYCKEHSVETCAHCGEQATHTTDTTFMGMGVGKSLCSHPRCKEIDNDLLSYASKNFSLFKPKKKETHEEYYYNRLAFNAERYAKYYETYGMEEDKERSTIYKAIQETATIDNVFETALALFSASTLDSKNMQDYAKKEISVLQSFLLIKERENRS